MSEQLTVGIDIERERERRIDYMEKWTSILENIQTVWFEQRRPTLEKIDLIQILSSTLNLLATQQ